MASNSEYEQQRFFKEKKFYKIPFFEKEYIVEIPMIWYADGRMEYNDSKVSNNWTINNEKPKNKINI